MNYSTQEANPAGLTDDELLDGIVRAWPFAGYLVRMTVYHLMWRREARQRERIYRGDLADSRRGRPKVSFYDRPMHRESSDD